MKYVHLELRLYMNRRIISAERSVGLNELQNIYSLYYARSSHPRPAPFQALLYDDRKHW